MKRLRTIFDRETIKGCFSLVIILIALVLIFWDLNSNKNHWVWLVSVLNWFSANRAELLVGLFFTFIGAVFALWYEKLGSPKLRIVKGKTTDDVKQNGYHTRFLHLDVINQPRTIFRHIKFPFVTSETANSCHGTITFCSNNGKPISKAMPIRWDGNPEPIRTEFRGAKGEVVQLFEPTLLRLERYIDIPACERESFAVAVRIEGDPYAYGCTGESYLPQYRWKHSDYRIPTGEWIANVYITTGDETLTIKVRFQNPENFSEFDLIEVEGQE